MRHISQAVFNVCLTSFFLTLNVCFVSSQQGWASDVAQQARALLSNRCFACHGPDDENREAGLRLDDPSGLFEEADSGDVPVIPGDLEESSILARIGSDDEYERMPPPEFGAKLTDEEVELLRQWIGEGAEFPQHWSFVPPVKPRVPELPVVPELAGLASLDGDSSSSPLTPVDHFVLSRLPQFGLKPNPPAERARLLRRVSLDLIGLPPTIEELDAFLADDTPGAYERQVARLLASPRFGERWGRKWLDLARYADSAGYADDPPRTIWAYRDWVIEAINNGLPIDEFTRKQIAGDLLPNSSRDDLIATAFNRNTMTNSEGGTNDEEFRNAAVVDRVNTTMAVWMGLTMGCAQCHTHKYDPITQHEYFQVFAVFNSTADADRRDESPLLKLFTQEQEDLKRSLQSQIEHRKALLDGPSEVSREEFVRWLKRIDEPAWDGAVLKSFKANSNSEASLSGSTAEVKAINANLLRDSYTVKVEVPTGMKQISAVSVDTIPGVGSPGAGLASNGNFVVTNISAKLVPAQAALPEARFVRLELPGKNKILSLAEVQVFVDGTNVAPSGTATQSSVAYNGPAARAVDGNTEGDFEAASTTHTETTADPWWEVDLGETQKIEKLVVWNRTDNNLLSRLDGALAVMLDDQRREVARATIKSAQASNDVRLTNHRALPFVSAFSDYEQKGFPATAAIDADEKSGWAVGGQESRAHQILLPLPEPVRVSPGDQIEFRIEQKSGFRNHVLGKFAIRLTGSSGAADWCALGKEYQAAVRSHRSGELVDLQSVFKFYKKELSPSTRSAREQIDALEGELAALQPATSVPIMSEVPAKERRETFVQIRGNYKSLGDKVGPGVPGIFHACESDSPTRLDLANWLVDRKNPLTARVWVNRTWESLFGKGIVPTSEEFGSQGDLPTHPRLLDWLAVELMESGWDNKALIRTIVLSRTYQQSSDVSEQKLEVDADNTWLARGPAMRLSAEMLRDQSLVAGGLLAGSLYGNPVRPPQPNLGLKAAFGGETDWKTSQGANRYRRGLYTMWRRSNPYPSMATFDAPSGEVCTLKRDSTNTPLQALVTLNDPAFVEAAQAMARRVLLSNPSSRDLDENATTRRRLVWAFRVATSRQASASETEALEVLLSNATQHFADRKMEASELATNPLGPLPAAFDVTEVAAWTAVCNVLLNLDEVLMKR